MGGFLARTVQQFESDSFGDALFAQVLLFQQQMAFHHRFRTVLWSHIESLSVLLRHQCPPNLSYAARAYFVPFESEKKVLDCQVQMLARAHSQSDTESFLYLLAVSHIAHAIWSGTHNLNLLSNVFALCRKAVVIDVVNCNFERLAAADDADLYADDENVQNEEDETLRARTKIKTILNIGRNRICFASNQSPKQRISVLKRGDFAVQSQKMSLFK